MIDCLERITHARTQREAWQVHVEAMAQYGFDRLLYGFTRFRTSNSFGNPNDLIILTNHTDKYAEAYVARGLFRYAPMTRWALCNTGACSWRWITDNWQYLSKKEHDVVALNRKHGVLAGYTISFSDPSLRNKGAIALAARPGLDQDDVDRIWREHGREIEVLNSVTHLKLISLPHANAARTLTKRQKQALEWVRDGKATHEIAEILGLTPATVEKHLRLAREKLEVDTTAQAVLKASLHHQIFVWSEEE